MSTGYFVDSSDKMLNERDHSSDEWKFQCPYCSSKNLLVSPINIGFRYNAIDPVGLPIEVVKYLKTVPTVVEAVMDNYTRDSTVMVECLSCKKATNGFLNGRKSCVPNKNTLKKYLIETYKITEGIDL